MVRFGCRELYKDSSSGIVHETSCTYATPECRPKLMGYSRTAYTNILYYISGCLGFGVRSCIKEVSV